MVNNVDCRFFALPRYSCFQEREENISHKILSLDFWPDRVSEWLGRDCDTRENMWVNDIKAQFSKLQLWYVISYFLKFWQDWNGKINGLQSRLKITFTTLLQHKTQKSLFMEISRNKIRILILKHEMNILKVIILYSW